MDSTAKITSILFNANDNGVIRNAIARDENNNVWEFPFISIHGSSSEKKPGAEVYQEFHEGHAQQITYEQFHHRLSELIQNAAPDCQITCYHSNDYMGTKEDFERFYNKDDLDGVIAVNKNLQNVMSLDDLRALEKGSLIPAALEKIQTASILEPAELAEITHYYNESPLPKALNRIKTVSTLNQQEALKAVDASCTAFKVMAETPELIVSGGGGGTRTHMYHDASRSF